MITDDQLSERARRKESCAGRQQRRATVALAARAAQRQGLHKEPDAVAGTALGARGAGPSGHSLRPRSHRYRLTKPQPDCSERAAVPYVVEAATSQSPRHSSQAQGGWASRNARGHLAQARGQLCTWLVRTWWCSGSGCRWCEDGGKGLGESRETEPAKL